MSLYYDSIGDIREIDDALYAAWVAAGNPKAAEWTLAPAKPSADAVWNAGSWTIPAPPAAPTVTPEQIRLWLESLGMTDAQVDQAFREAAGL